MEKVISIIKSCKTSEQLCVMEEFIEKRFEGMEKAELRGAMKLARQWRQEGKNKEEVAVENRIWAEMMLSA